MPQVLETLARRACRLSVGLSESSGQWPFADVPRRLTDTTDEWHPARQCRTRPRDRRTPKQNLNQLLGQEEGRRVDGHSHHQGAANLQDLTSHVLAGFFLDRSAAWHERGRARQSKLKGVWAGPVWVRRRAFLRQPQPQERLQAAAEGDCEGRLRPLWYHT